MSDNQTFRVGVVRRLAGGHRYWPALDGLRALAVVAVLCFHQGYGWADGGFLGVSLFFTLSGFLITSLVLEAHALDHKVGLQAFWARRLRRLAPVALLGLVLAIAVAVFAMPDGQRPDVLADVRAALFYVANWRFIGGESAYFDVGSVPSPVQHYWSLAIEEQFYVVFPVLAAVTLRRGRRWLVGALVAIVALSLWRQLAESDVTRVYFGTDTRIAEIAVGCLLAVWLAARRDRPVSAPRVWAGAGWAALAATVVAWGLVGRADPLLGQGGLVALAVVSAVLIRAAMLDGRLSRLLSVSPLPAIGRVSYGLYVFHFPIFIWLTPDRAGVGGTALFAIRLVATGAITFGVYKLIEQPIRVGARLQGWKKAVPAMAVATASVVAVTAFVAVDRPPPFVVELASIPVSSPPGSVPLEVSDADVELAPVPQGDPPHILVIGDSTAVAIGKGLKQWGEKTGRLLVDVVAGIGCSVLPGREVQLRDSHTFKLEGCDQLLNFAFLSLLDSPPDAVVLFHGTSQLGNWKLEGSDEWQHLGQPDFDLKFIRAADEMLTRLTETGAPVLWADVPLPNWNPEWEGYAEQGIVFTGDGPITINSPPRVKLFNDYARYITGFHPGATYWPFARNLAGDDGVIEVAQRPDGVHLDEEQVGLIAEEWLFAELGRNFRELVDDPMSGTAAPRDTSWMNLLNE